MSISEIFSQLGNICIFLSILFFRNCNSERKVWLVTLITNSVSSFRDRGLQRPAKFPKISFQFSTMVRSGEGFSSLYFSLIRSRMESIETGGCFEDSVTVLGNLRKSAITSSAFLEKFIMIGNLKISCCALILLALHKKYH